MFERLKQLLFGTKAKPRSPQWPAFEKIQIHAHPYCSACGGRKNLQLHHIWPFSWPGGEALELTVANTIVLCMAPGRSCHLYTGHLGDFASRNPDVVVDAATMLAKIKFRPYPDKR